MRGTLVYPQEISSVNGKLTIFEHGKCVPFPIERVFCITDASGLKRGMHAQRTLFELVYCIKGSVTIDIDDGDSVRTYYLSEKEGKALLIPSMTWRELLNFGEGTILIVFASEPYDEDDYIRDYADFIREVRKS